MPLRRGDVQRRVTGRILMTRKKDKRVVEAWDQSKDQIDNGITNAHTMLHDVSMFDNTTWHDLQSF